MAYTLTPAQVRAMKRATYFHPIFWGYKDAH
jgi:hypothetical protein